MDAGKSLVAAPKGTKGTRPRSQVSFPYYNEQTSVEVAERIHTESGGGCTREQLAPILGYSGTKNGGFVARVNAARMFGLIEEHGKLFRPTQLAAQIYAPVQEVDADRAKVEAFLNVELFQKVYERFRGQPLPSQQGLENLLKTEFLVVPAQIKNALRTLQESAEYAGFFDAAGRGRLVLPLAANTKSSMPSAAQAVSVSDTSIPASPATSAASVGRMLNVEDSKIPAAIYGLIRDLPEEGTTMSSAKRERLIKAFEASINWLYPDEEDPHD